MRGGLLFLLTSPFPPPPPHVTIAPPSNFQQQRIICSAGYSLKASGGDSNHMLFDLFLFSAFYNEQSFGVDRGFTGIYSLHAVSPQNQSNRWIILTDLIGRVRTAADMKNLFSSRFNVSNDNLHGKSRPYPLAACLQWSFL